MLLGTFVDEVWWPSCGKLRECTRVGYESAYRCHIQPKWADVDMESITANDIEEWLGSFNQAGAARKAWAVLRAILRLAYRKGVTDNDVTRREIRLPHLRRYEPRVLDARQVRRLLKGFYGHALEAWLLVSVCAGLRRCESVGIEWADLDLRRGIVTVKGQCNGSLDMKRSPTRRPTRADGRSHYHGSQSNGSRNCATAEPAGWSAI
ncbi:MAG: tyrosine-type recombinase/integrase [Bifidobacterium sp.]